MVRPRIMHSRFGLWRRLDTASRLAWPSTFLIFGLLFIGLPFGLPGQAELRLAYALACVFFWSLYRPSALPAPVVAVTGLLLDLLGMTPAGLWALLLLLVHGAVLATRRRLAPQRFWLIWMVFAGLAAGFCGLGWALQSLLTLTMLPVQPLGAECLTAAGLYPVLAALFIRAHRGPAAAELA